MENNIRRVYGRRQRWQEGRAPPLPGFSYMVQISDVVLKTGLGLKTIFLRSWSWPKRSWSWSWSWPGRSWSWKNRWSWSCKLVVLLHQWYW